MITNLYGSMVICQIWGIITRFIDRDAAIFLNHAVEFKPPLKMRWYEINFYCNWDNANSKCSFNGFYTSMTIFKSDIVNYLAKDEMVIKIQRLPCLNWLPWFHPCKLAMDLTQFRGCWSNQGILATEHLLLSGVWALRSCSGR